MFPISPTNEILFVQKQVKISKKKFTFLSFAVYNKTKSFSEDKELLFVLSVLSFLFPLFQIAELRKPLQKATFFLERLIVCLLFKQIKHFLGFLNTVSNFYVSNDGALI